MKTTIDSDERELALSRIIDVPREKLYRAWTEPALLEQWFAPRPFTTPVAELDVRPGGSNLIIMRGPDGNDMPNRGVYLEVVPNERLVFTNAYTEAWGRHTTRSSPLCLPSKTLVMEKPSIRRACFIGHPQTARSTRKWVSIRVGANVPIS